jgi:alpha-galactosidase/6-phospho-beta-glucosidase family protein
MEPSDVVEIPALIERNTIVPRAVGDIPGHCLGLMKQVKAFEIMTIEAALESSYAKALVALTLNPLVHDYNLAKLVLDAYIQQHQLSFPKLH